MTCNHNNIVKFVEDKLDLDHKLETLLHIEQCTTCFEELYKLKKLKDKKHFIYKSYDDKDADDEDVEEIAG